MYENKEYLVGDFKFLEEHLKEIIELRSQAINNSNAKVTKPKDNKSIDLKHLHENASKVMRRTRSNITVEEFDDFCTTNVMAEITNIKRLLCVCHPRNKDNMIEYKVVDDEIKTERSFSNLFYAVQYYNEI